jgi:hypothetical protein
MGRIYWNDSSRLVDSGAPIDVLAIGDSRLRYAFDNLITPPHTALEQPTMHVIGERGAGPGCGCPARRACRRDRADHSRQSC